MQYLKPRVKRTTVFYDALEVTLRGEDLINFRWRAWAGGWSPLPQEFICWALGEDFGEGEAKTPAPCQGAIPYCLKSENLKTLV